MVHLTDMMVSTFGGLLGFPWEAQSYGRIHQLLEEPSMLGARIVLGNSFLWQGGHSDSLNEPNQKLKSACEFIFKRSLHQQHIMPRLQIVASNQFKKNEERTGARALRWSVPLQQFQLSRCTFMAQFKNYFSSSHSLYLQLADSFGHFWQSFSPFVMTMWSFSSILHHKAN